MKRLPDSRISFSHISIPAFVCLYCALCCPIAIGADDFSVSRLEFGVAGDFHDPTGDSSSLKVLAVVTNVQMIGEFMDAISSAPENSTPMIPLWGTFTDVFAYDPEGRRVQVIHLSLDGWTIEVTKSGEDGPVHSVRRNPKATEIAAKILKQQRPDVFKQILMDYGHVIRLTSNLVLRAELEQMIPEPPPLAPKATP